MKIIVIYFAYLWIGLLHATLVGTTIFAWCKNGIAKRGSAPYALLIFCILLFFETYWVYVFNYLGLQVFCVDAAILQYFNLSSSNNIVAYLSIRIITIISCLLQTVFAVYLGKRLLKKIFYA